MSLLPTPRRALLLALRMMAVLAVQAVAGMGLTAQSALAQAIVVRDDRVTGMVDDQPVEFPLADAR